MSGDKKDLRLVKPSPPTSGEVEAEAASLGDFLGGGDLAPDDHEALLAMVLGDDAADVSAGERGEAEALARALEGEGEHPLATLAATLRSAQRAAEIDGADHEALLAATLGVEARGEAPVMEHEDFGEVLRAAYEPWLLAEGDADALLAVGLGVEPVSTARGAHEALAEVLRAAHRPSEMDPTDARLLEALTLGAEVDADLAGGARAEAERFAASLTGEGDHALLALAETLRAADDRGRPLDALSHERILRAQLRATAPRRPWIAGLVAVAAAIVLFASFGTRSRPPVAELGPAPDFVEVHSTASLFSEPFAAKGGESARMSRIVAARAADLRHNRFAAWGVE